MLMGRNARSILPGLPYHVTQRGTNRQRYFAPLRIAKTYLSLIARRWGERFRWSVLVGRLGDMASDAWRGRAN